MIDNSAALAADLDADLQDDVAIVCNATTAVPNVVVGDDFDPRPPVRRLSAAAHLDEGMWFEVIRRDRKG